MTDTLATAGLVLAVTLIFCSGLVGFWWGRKACQCASPAEAAELAAVGAPDLQDVHAGWFTPPESLRMSSLPLPGVEQARTTAPTIPVRPVSATAAEPYPPAAVAVSRPPSTLAEVPDPDSYGRHHRPAEGCGERTHALAGYTPKSLEKP